MVKIPTVGKNPYEWQPCPVSMSFSGKTTSFFYLFTYVLASVLVGIFEVNMSFYMHKKQLKQQNFVNSSFLRKIWSKAQALCGVFKNWNVEKRFAEEQII